MYGGREGPASVYRERWQRRLRLAVGFEATIAGCVSTPALQTHSAGEEGQLNCLPSTRGLLDADDLVEHRAGRRKGDVRQ
jgi:hypothetical protein